MAKSMNLDSIIDITIVQQIYRIWSFIRALVSNFCLVNFEHHAKINEYHF